MIIAAYNQHLRPPFFPSLWSLRYQIYSGSEEADDFMKSATGFLTTLRRLFAGLQASGGSSSSESAVLLRAHRLRLRLGHVRFFVGPWRQQVDEHQQDDERQQQETGDEQAFEPEQLHLVNG